MKKLKLMKTLLVAVGLLLGTSAWAGVTKIFDQPSWTHTHDGGTGDRSASLSFDGTASIEDNWTASYDVTITSTFSRTNGARNFQVALASASASFPANALLTSNVLLGARFVTTNNTNYSSFPCTITVNDVDEAETVTLNHSTKYTFTVSVSGTSMTVSIKNGETSVFSKAVTLAAFVKPKGIFDLLPRPFNKDYGVYTDTYSDILVTKEVDEEIVSTPTIAIAYAGANRTVTITPGVSSESNAVTTYYTLNGANPTSSSSVYSAPLDVDENCTVKAITISSEDVSSEVASLDVTVGKLTLNAPSFTKTAFSEGTYTYTIASDQSGLDFVPASTTIKYRVGETGDYSNYSAGVSVDEGKILYAYVEATNYTNSSVASVTAVSLPAMTRAFGQNYAGVVNSQLKMTVSEGTVVTNAVSTADANYFIPSSDGTKALTNENISFYFSYDGSDTGKNKFWYLNTDGMYTAFGRGSANVKIDNLTVGQIVKISSSNFDSVTGLTKLDAYSYGNTNYYVATATTAYVSLARYCTLYSVDVYDLDNETIGSLDCSTNYGTKWNTTPIWINAGETAYYKFKNYNNGGSTLYHNWYLFAANESSTNLAIFGPNHTNTADGGNGSYTSKPTYTMSDLNGATVELTATLADAGDDTYTLTVTGVTTKADGSTKLTPDLVYTQKGLTVSKLKLFISPEKNWLELLQEAVKKNITSAGYATYYSNNALDFANATPALTASLITGAVGETAVLALDDVENVPAETGVLLAGDEGTYTIPVIASSSTVTTSNKLEGVHVATIKDAESIYVLMASPKVGFYNNANAFTVGANTAYLPVGFAAARAFYLFDEDATGINAVSATKAETGDYYNLAGQRVAQPTKGLYIVNGKKVVIK